MIFLNFWSQINECTNDTTDIKLPLCARVMLLDSDFGKVITFRGLLAHVYCGINDSGEILENAGKNNI